MEPERNGSRRLALDVVQMRKLNMNTHVCRTCLCVCVRVCEFVSNNKFGKISIQVRGTHTHIHGPNNECLASPTNTQICGRIGGLDWWMAFYDYSILPFIDFHTSFATLLYEGSTRTHAERIYVVRAQSVRINRSTARRRWSRRRKRRRKSREKKKQKFTEQLNNEIHFVEKWN